MKMKLFEVPVRLVEIDLRFRKHLDLLEPVLSELDLEKLSDNSGIEFDADHVYINIIPIHYTFAGLQVYIEKSRLSVCFAETEQYKNHHDNSVNNPDLKAIN